MKYRIIQGDNRDVLALIPDNSIDSIITDPPYGIAFLGKDWDHKKATETTTKIALLHNLPSGMKHTTLADDLEFQYWLRERWIECLRVLKPGGHLLAFSAARTYHHMAMSLQTAGFEIRDQIMWIYSSGFPKSQDVGRQLHKKAHGKPDKQRFSTDEMIKEGDLYRHKNNNKLYRILPDINGDRLEKSHEGQGYGVVFEEVIEVHNEWSGWGTALKPAHEPICLARKPTKLSTAQNVQRWGTGALNIDATRIPTDEPMVYCGNGINRMTYSQSEPSKWNDSNKEMVVNDKGRFPSNVIGEIQEPYQKFFYCPKVSRAERHMGHEMPPAMFGQMEGCYDENGQRYAVELDRREGNVGNNHPTESS
jgi:hypothetical protein